MEVIVIKIVEVALLLTALKALKNTKVKLKLITITSGDAVKPEGLQRSVYRDIYLLQMESKQGRLSVGLNYDLRRTSKANKCAVSKSLHKKVRALI